MSLRKFGEQAAREARLRHPLPGEAHARRELSKERDMTPGMKSAMSRLVNTLYPRLGRARKKING